MKETKEYKGLYFSNNINNNKNSNKSIKKKLKKTFFENGAHFKYSSLYNELQKLFKKQNYSLPKKIIKRKKKDIQNSEKNKKTRLILNNKLQLIKNKNNHNSKEKKLDNKNNISIKNYTFNNNKKNKNYYNISKLQTIANDKKSNNYNYSSFNSENTVLKNKKYENTIKNNTNNKKSKIFQIISNIKKKSVENKFIKKYNGIQKSEKKKYSSSFVKSIFPNFINEKQKNIKLYNNDLSTNSNKDIIKVKTKILTPSNKTQKIKKKKINKLFNIETERESNFNFEINNSFIINRNKNNFHRNTVINFK